MKILSLLFGAFWYFFSWVFSIHRFNQMWIENIQRKKKSRKFKKAKLECFIFWQLFVVLQLPSHVWLFMIPWIAACQASISLTISQNLPKLTSSESVMPSNHLILCWPLLFLPSFSPSIRVFFNESALYIAFIYLFYKWYLRLITLHLYSLVVQLVKNPPAMRDLDLIPGLRRSPWEGNGYPLQYSCLENFMDRELGRLQSMRLQRVRYDWATFTHSLT